MPYKWLEVTLITTPRSLFATSIINRGKITFKKPTNIDCFQSAQWGYGVPFWGICGARGRHLSECS